MRLLIAIILLPASGSASGQVVIDRADYTDHLRAMWLGECLANWTGLRGEGQRIQPPFPTDADWGTDLGRGVLEFVIQDPWGADDDTDIEYVWLHLMHGQGPLLLTPDAIAQGWHDHVNDFIWVSNAEARALMDRGVRPPGTGLAAANRFWLHIDAQLTTEIFGALAPGMPQVALELADPAIRNVAAGHAAHAAHFHVVLYSLAPLVDRSLPRPAQIEWLVREARAYLPDSSKAADVIDFVLADYLANPDVNDWERTRDAVYARYQLNDASHGFKYRGWTESSVNLATGVIALLYGQGDFKRTIQIGTLSGWDADNGTATMGGLLGLLSGTSDLRAQFPGIDLSDRYWILRTRENLPDYLPTDPLAEDSFAGMALCMAMLVDDAIDSGGGVVDSTGWFIPPAPVGAARTAANPLVALDARSQVLAERRAGRPPGAQSSVTSLAPSARGVRQPSALASGFHMDFSGADVLNDGARRFYSSERPGQPGNGITLTLQFQADVPCKAIRLIEGNHYLTGRDAVEGGWFDSISVEVLCAGEWLHVPSIPSEPLSSQTPFQVIDWNLPDVLTIRAVRLTGMQGGADGFVTVAAIDVLGPEVSPRNRGFDVNLDGRVDVDDLYSWYEAPVDLTGDGQADATDSAALEGALRWNEIRDMQGPRRP